MSEPRDGAAPPVPAKDPPPAAATEPPRTPEMMTEAAPVRPGGNTVYWLAGSLMAVLIIVITAPWWAPELLPLLPAGRPPPVTTQAPPPPTPPAAPTTDPALAARLERLEAARDKEQQGAGTTAAALREIERRLTALEARPAPPPPPDLSGLRQELSALRQEITTATRPLGELAGRLDAVEKAARAQAADDHTDSALLLVVLQIREAIDTARPFAAEYDVFAALARTRPDIAAAASPLADAAKAGVAGRAVLVQRLSALAGGIATAATPAAEADWEAQSWARLRSLVTVRRIGGPGQSAPEAAVSAAQRAMAQGDLAGAIAALDKLTGANADAAAPWLQMARARLAAEAALHKVETLLAARLASAPVPPRP